MSVSVGSVWGVQAAEEPAETGTEKTEELSAKNETEASEKATFVTSFRERDHEVNRLSAEAEEEAEEKVEKAAKALEEE